MGSIVCRYAEWYQCACDFVIYQDFYNMNKNTRSWHNNNVNAHKGHHMFSPLLNEHTGEVWHVENSI